MAAIINNFQQLVGASDIIFNVVTDQFPAGNPYGVTWHRLPGGVWFVNFPFSKTHRNRMAARSKMSLTMVPVEFEGAPGFGPQRVLRVQIKNFNDVIVSGRSIANGQIFDTDRNRDADIGLEIMIETVRQTTLLPRVYNSTFCTKSSVILFHSFVDMKKNELTFYQDIDDDHDQNWVFAIPNMIKDLAEVALDAIVIE